MNQKALEEVIYEIALRIRLYRESKISKPNNVGLSDLEVLILELLDKKGTLTISNFCELLSTNSSSTVSTTITKLWKEKKLVNKKISPENQRITLVDLTAKGRKEFEKIKNSKIALYSAIKKAMETSAEEETLIRTVFERAIVYFDKEILK
jgi:DNA-binding MarR family transcriptional regulator